MVFAKFPCLTYSLIIYYCLYSSQGVSLITIGFVSVLQSNIEGAKLVKE